MNIGIDIDDTITKTSEETDIYAKEYTESILKRKFEPQNIEIFDPMWAKHLYNWTDEENDKFWDLYYEKIMENVKPKEDAVEVINNLSVKNNIIIITARWDRESGIIAKITKEWLKRNKINYEKLYIGHKDKRKISEECKIDVNLFFMPSSKFLSFLLIVASWGEALSAMVFSSKIDDFIF